ncbi:LysM peptidoglycan-binding domain-containing protein [Cryptosporangium aurantiacum]|uniref:LysM domain-containing protein n=1 Tax=Cryptosporangium aurantiacum TaxID=134849 RepID=A0A1M7R8Q6_9ACTN|nr:LysM peptidoglycan-binding domain-containing protein [Cryptosporangium aurantiacum]SHN42704.1 LysM domain-containing protein [Cryptosporangium aurantiacum]
MSSTSTSRRAGRSRPRQVLSGLAALLVLLGTLIGVPVLLAVLGGNPLPDHVPSAAEVGNALTSPDDGTLFLRVLTVAGWLGWATFALSVLVEVPAAVLRRPAPRLPGLRAQQRIAATLIAAVALIAGSSTVASAAMAPAASAAMTPAASAAMAPPAASTAGTVGTSVGTAGTVVGTAAPVAGSLGTASWSAAVPRDALPPLPVRTVSHLPTDAASFPGSAVRPVAGGSTYVVAPGDRLADIAARFLGDPDRYPKLAAANSLSDPDEIAAGQRLVLPADARDRGASQYAAGPVQGASSGSYVVAPGDRLSDVAERFLGDPDRYPELATGSGVDDPDEIRPGERITLPPDARDRGTDEHASGHVDTKAPDTKAPEGKAPDGKAPDGKAPDGKAPDSKAPDGKAPDGKAPDSKAPAEPAPGGGKPAPVPPAPTPDSPRTPDSTRTPDRSPATPAPGGVPQTQERPDSTLPTGASGGADPQTRPAAHHEGLSPLLPVGVPLAGAGLLTALLLARGRRQQAFVGRHRRHRGHRKPPPKNNRPTVVRDGFIAAPPRPTPGIPAQRQTEPRADLPPSTPAEPDANARLDLALRVLATGLTDRSPDEMPDVLGAWVEQDTVRLILSRPCPDPPAPWTGAELTWELAADAELPDTTGVPAPLPMLVTVGTRGSTPLLLDVERLGVLTLTGDEFRADDLLRHIGAELAGAPWSDDVEILIAGFDSEQTNHLAMLGDGRIEPVPTIADGIGRMRRRVSQALGIEPSAAGRHAAKDEEDEDEWAPTILLAADPDLEETIALGELDADLATTGRCGVGVVASLRGDLGRWPLPVTEDGAMSAGFIGIHEPDLLAARLSPSRLGSLAELFVDSALKG